MTSLCSFAFAVMMLSLSSNPSLAYGDGLMSWSYFGPSTNVYLVGEHSLATHYVKKGSDVVDTLQVLLNNVSLTGKPSTIVIAQGQYFLSKNIQIGSNTHLTGTGMDKSILKLSNWASKFDKAGLVRSVLTSNVTISNITLDGNKYNQFQPEFNLEQDVEYNNSITYGRYGIFTEASINVTFESVHVTNFQGYGFDPHGQKKTLTYGNNLTIRHCLSSYNQWDGYTIDQTFNTYIYNSTSRNNGRHGFNVVTGSRFIVIDSVTSINDGYYYSVNSTGCGITIQDNKFYGTSNAIFKNNIIVTPKKGGICTKDVKYVTMTNNIITAQTCMRIENTTNANIKSTTCINSSPTRRIMIDTLSSSISVSNTTTATDKPQQLTGNSRSITIGYSNRAEFKIDAQNDAHSQFQLALDAIVINGGGSLFVEAGVYILSGYIETGGNTRIIGSGMDKTVLRLEDKAVPWWVPNTGIRRSGFIRATSVNNLVIANLTLDGNRLNQNNDTYSHYGRYGLFTEACNNVSVDGVKIINFQGYGFDPHGSKSLKLWGVNLTITNSHAENNGFDGFTIDQSRQVLLHNNIAKNNARHGFNIVTGTTNMIMTNNVAIDNGFWYSTTSRGCGIMIQNNLEYGTSNVSVFNSTITNSADAAVCATEVKYIKVINNLVNRTSVNTCIRLRNVTVAEVSGNMCIFATRGVNVQTSKSVTLKSNTIVP